MAFAVFGVMQPGFACGLHCTLHGSSHTPKRHVASHAVRAAHSFCHDASVSQESRAPVPSLATGPKAVVVFLDPAPAVRIPRPRRIHRSAPSLHLVPELPPPRA